MATNNVKTVKTVKTQIETRWNDAERLHAARAGVQLQDRYIVDVPIDSPLLMGIDQDDEGVLSLQAWRCLRDALMRVYGADLSGALAAATAAYKDALAEEAAKKAAAVAGEAAEKERKKKIAEARELLAGDLACMRDEIERLKRNNDIRQNEIERLKKLALFIQSRELEEAFYAFLNSEAPGASERFAADFNIDARGE
jgi:hypothetical protein